MTLDKDYLDQFTNERIVEFLLEDESMSALEEAINNTREQLFTLSIFRGETSDIMLDQEKLEVLLLKVADAVETHLDIDDVERPTISYDTTFNPSRNWIWRSYALSAAAIPLAVAFPNIVTIPTAAILGLRSVSAYISSRKMRPEEGVVASYYPLTNHIMVGPSSRIPLTYFVSHEHTHRVQHHERKGFPRSCSVVAEGHADSTAEEVCKYFYITSGDKRFYELPLVEKNHYLTNSYHLLNGAISASDNPLGLLFFEPNVLLKYSASLGRCFFAVKEALGEEQVTRKFIKGELEI